MTPSRCSVIRLPLALLALLLALGPLPAAGAAGDDLFAAEVEVADTSLEARAAGIVAAFAAVLTKATGRGEPEAFPAWPRVSAEAERLLTEYRYHTATPTPGAAAAPPAMRLTVSFDRPGVEALLRAERLPLWGDTRPVTLLLLAVERGTERFIYTPDALPGAAASIAAAARRRGIPLIEPLMDLEDRDMLRFNEVWGGFPEVIGRAAARYGPDAVLVARLFGEGAATWRAQWTLHLGGGREGWQSQGTLAATLDAGLDRLAETLARRYVPDPSSGEERLALAVTGIRNPADYARVMAFLGSLTAISELRPRLASREVLEIELVTDVEAGALLRTIAMGDTLAPVDGVGVMRDALPRFRLRP